MVTLTKVFFDTFFEPVVQDHHESFSNSKQKPVSVSNGVAGNGNDVEEREDVRRRKHIYISPALYATPKQTPIPDGASDPPSPSPYIVNHKRRGSKAFLLRSDGFNESTPLKLVADENKLDNENEIVDVLEESFDRKSVETYTIEDDLLDSRFGNESTFSCNEVDDNGKQIDNQSYVSYQGEFFDAIEELSMDGSMSSISGSYIPKLESELRSTRMGLLDEVEKRRKAEYDLSQVYNQWEKLSNTVSTLGLSFPSLTDASSFQFDSSLNQLHQEIIVARFLSEAIVHDTATAQAELAAEEIIESKNHEINRLRDRLQYYEAVNNEMCLRNQENMELARNQRRRRKQRRWLWWGCVGLFVSVGASAIGYSYTAQARTDNTSDASCTS